MVAEGIETPEQAGWFQSLGCQFGQGFYFSEPLRPDQAGDYLAGRDVVTPLPAAITRLDSRRRRSRAVS